MPVRTSQVTSGSGDDLSLNPAAGKSLKISSSLDKNNAGETPLATTSSTGVVKRLDMDNLELHPPAPEDDDWVLYQDTGDSKIVKKLKATDLGGAKQPPFNNLPTEGPWVDTDTVLAVKEGGAGSTAALRNSVEFAVNNATYNQSDKNVVANDTVKVRWDEAKMIAANQGQTISGTLYGKTGSKFTQTWNLNINKQPTAGWVLADLNGQPTSTQIESYVTFPTGYNAPSPVTIDGGTLTNIEVSVNGAAFTATPGNIKDGQTIQVRGTTGAVDSTGYTALVSIGGLQRTWTVTTAASLLAVAQPTITSPANNAIDLGSSITVTSSAYTPLNGAGTHASSDWELKKAGVVVSSSMASTTDLESWTIPATDLEGFTTYTVRVLHRSSDPVDSPWSVESTFTTGDLTLKPGDPYGGGYFAGRIWDGGAWDLIVAPISSGGLSGLATGLKFGAVNGFYLGTSGSITDYNGGRNQGDQYTDALPTPGTSNPAFDWVKGPGGPNAGTFDLTDSTGTGIGGHNDWYLPGQAEVDVMYKNLKPYTMPDNVANANGINKFRVKESGGVWVQAEDVSYDFSPEVPQTEAELFKESNAESFGPYKTGSSTYIAGTGQFISQSFGSGGLQWGGLASSTTADWRAVRRVPSLPPV